MIFYFTGTGNSLHAARMLAEEGEQLINITKARRARAFTYDRGAAAERIGFVFPEYCSTIPDIVYDFVQHLDIRGKGYTFSVVTSGSGKHSSNGLLRELLAKRGAVLDFAECVGMPNNCVTIMEPTTGEDVTHQLAAADEKLRAFKQQLAAKACCPAKSAFLAKAMRPVYHLANATKPFFAEDSCIKCGKCAGNCPDHAIRIKNGKPVWVLKHCEMCLACINRCPVQAIQYGKQTKGRARYTHPSL